MENQQINDFNIKLIQEDAELLKFYKAFLKRKLEYDALQFKGMRDALKERLNSPESPAKGYKLPTEEF